jgi:hypothetical protein
MSHYNIGKLVFDTRHNESLNEEWKTDPEAVMEKYGFTEEEKDAMRRKDIVYFYELGVNPYSIGRVAGLMGMDNMTSRTALANARPHPFLPTVWFPGRPTEGNFILHSHSH